MATFALAWDEIAPTDCRGGALSVGNFDGVHRGHAALLAELRRRAAPGPAVVLTFDPHPSQLLRPTAPPPALTTLPERARLLHDAGADHVVFLGTTPDLLRLGPEEFFARVLRGGFDARAVVEGDNFRFGRDRAGDVHLLEALCRSDNVSLSVVPPLLLDGEPVSSSRVRAALTRGDVTAAATLLGRPYRVAGTVGEGKRRGRTLGFPTANLDAIATLLPADGVYAVRAAVDATVRAGAANVGPNPTFGEAARKVEIHLIDYEGDLYGRTLTVDFVERLRDTKTFAGIAELTAQLHADVAQARRVTAID